MMMGNRVNGQSLGTVKWRVNKKASIKGCVAAYKKVGTRMSPHTRADPITRSG